MNIMLLFVTMMIRENENDENDADDDGNEVIDKSKWMP